MVPIMKQSKPPTSTSSVSRIAKAKRGQLSEDLIRTRAFALYEARNGENGTAQDDWMQARTALSEELGLKVTEQS